MGEFDHLTPYLHLNSSFNTIPSSEVQSKIQNRKRNEIKFRFCEYNRKLRKSQPDTRRDKKERRVFYLNSQGVGTLAMFDSS